MKIRKTIAILAAAIAFTGMSGIDQAQAQIVEFQDKGISMWIPDRFHVWSSYSDQKIFECRGRTASEVDSRVSMEIIHDSDSVDRLAKDEARFVSRSSDIIGQQSYVSGDGSEQSYLLYNEDHFGRDEIVGYIFNDMGNGQKLKIKVTMPATLDNQQDFYDMTDSICLGAK